VFAKLSDNYAKQIKNLREVLMDSSWQNRLFLDDLPSSNVSPPLTSDVSIRTALDGYEDYLKREAVSKSTGLPLSQNTQKAFLSDIRLLGDYMGIGQPVGAVSTNNLNEFLDWLVNERGVPCSRKSYARRVTSLKHFFTYVNLKGARPDNPSDAIIQISVSSPLPNLPSDSHLDQALSVTKGIMKGYGGQKPDARPHLLLTLLLQTGIKKQETMRIVLYHIIRNDPIAPVLFIPYSGKKERAYKERRMALEAGWLDTLDTYIEQYHPSDALFTCTARNLEYVLSNVGEEIGLEQGSLSFENLRWVYALRLYRSDKQPKWIKSQLGLFDSSWRETKRKLEQLAEKQEQPPIRVA
jgi:site-specific recombinase XerD